MRRIHGVEDILLGFEPKDAGSIPAGSVFSKAGLFEFDTPKILFLQIIFLAIEFSDWGYSDNSIRAKIYGIVAVGEIPYQGGATPPGTSSR